MKAVFKVWNFLMIGAALIGMLITSLAVLGGSLTSDGALMFFLGLLAFIPLIFTFVMARAGLRGDYQKARKLAFIVLFLDIVNLYSNGAKGVFSLLLVGAYIYMALSLDKYHY